VRSYVSQIPTVEQKGAQRYDSLADYKSGIADPHYTHIDDPPSSENLDRALYALGAYEEFCQNSPEAKSEVLSRPHWNDWHDSDWYRLGVDALTAASQVLQQYWYQPKSQAAVEDKLADLRSAARSVAQLISESPSIHDGYFVGDRVANHDELSRTMQDSPNIFRCEVNWGCFWQERPEDTIALYRELMSSPVFCYIHSDFWHRTPIQPRLVAWDEEDEKNIPAIWENFVRSLNDSTNVLLQMEAKALMNADATNDEDAKAAVAAWWNIVRSHRDELVGNNVELFYLGWGFVYNPETEAMDEDYWRTTIPARQTTSAFEQQKQYFAHFTPYDFQAFVDLFGSKNYSREQASELKPLIAAYESNMVARASSQKDLFFAKADAQWIHLFLEKPIDDILNPPAPVATVATKNPLAAPPVRARPAVPVAATFPLPEEIPAHILRVNQFIKIPSEPIQPDEISGSQIFAQRWSEGKLLFGIAYTKEKDTYYTNGSLESASENSKSAIAIFDPANQQWDTVNCPETREGSWLAMTMQDISPQLILYHGHLYSSMDGTLKEFDFQKQEWRTLEISGENASDLFSVAGHLYAADPESIIEITDDGGCKILASTRRRPAVTMLDSLDTFAVRPFFPRPQLFAGPEDSLCASIGNKIYRWDGKDWHEILSMNISQPPEILDDALVFRAVAAYGSDDRSCLWLWNKSQAEPELYLSDKPRPHPGIITSPYRRHKTQLLHPRWESLPDDYLTSAPAAAWNSNLYFLVEHTDAVRSDNGTWSAVEKNSYHARLVCLSRDQARPIAVPLRFDTTRAQPPLKVLGQKMEPWLNFDSSALEPILHFSGDALYLTERGTPGVWVIPASELQSAVATAKQTLIAQIAQEKADLEKQMAERQAAREKIRRQLLAKYDRNHNGIIDPDEKEEALDDPVFIEYELDNIDANHDGWLEANEVSWFDANRNKHLDPKEAAGINIAQHLLAVRLMKKFDADGKGYLSDSEFSDLKQACVSANGEAFDAPEFPGRMFGPIDLPALENFLKQQTSGSLRLRGFGLPGRWIQFGGPGGVMSKTRAFQLEVEYYWAHSGAHTN